MYFQCKCLLLTFSHLDLLLHLQQQSLIPVIHKLLINSNRLELPVPVRKVLLRELKKETADTELSLHAMCLFEITVENSVVVSLIIEC